MSDMILVVEDDEALLASVSMDLQFEGYTVLNAKDGRSALEVYENKVLCQLLLVILFIKLSNPLRLGNFFESKCQMNP
ncbi:response regulator [Levilactobacillus fuyuanensis]|uniref:Response regulatory domain-containing protein n=1 Tax=Levilactobacillus fuyuanensis TaxID=2486022 RepID=A0ABW4H5X2_9LACO